MDRYELEAALSRAGLREYEIPGVHELGWRPSEYPYLQAEDDRWVVGIYERGMRVIMRRFADEDEACRFFYALLTENKPPPATALGAEDSNELIEHAEETQRAAWEAYEQARRSQEPRYDGPGPGPPETR